MFGKMKATKKNFYEYVTKNEDGIEQYLPILSNELYDRFISERTKNTLGIKQLYVNDAVSTVKLNEKATDSDTVIAYNELTNLYHKTMSFTRFFKDEAHSDYHQSVTDLTANKPSDAKMTPKILSFDDLIKEIEEQPEEEQTVCTDEEIADGDVSRISSKILDFNISLLKMCIEACLISVILEINFDS